MYNICSSSDKFEAIKRFFLIPGFLTSTELRLVLRNSYCNKHWKETSLNSAHEKTDQLSGKYLYSQKASLTFAYQNRDWTEILRFRKMYGICT